MKRAEWAIVVIALTGTVLNVFQNRWCFALWLISNALLVWLMARLKRWPLMGLYAVYAVLAVVGWFTWSRA